MAAYSYLRSISANANLAGARFKQNKALMMMAEELS